MVPSHQSEFGKRERTDVLSSGTRFLRLVMCVESSRLPMSFIKNYACTESFADRKLSRVDAENLSSHSRAKFSNKSPYHDRILRKKTNWLDTKRCVTVAQKEDTRTEIERPCAKTDLQLHVHFFVSLPNRLRHCQCN